MGLRRRVQQPSSSSSSSSSLGSSGPNKRSRAENNNSPSQGNLNSSTSSSAETIAGKRARASGSAFTTVAPSRASKPGSKSATPWSEPGLGGLGIPYMAPRSMATFVGTSSLSKSPTVSYLDISNMTARKPSPPRAFPEFPEFANSTMFGAYQPWVIKTYGDLAKTKTITIKKYARILRTLRGEEVNSAENSKFRFWVKSKGFHIGQPDGYEAKPADRIIGRHAVSSPGLDPPLYVPTQLPHNKVSGINSSYVNRLGISLIRPGETHPGNVHVLLKFNFGCSLPENQSFEETDQPYHTKDEQIHLQRFYQFKKRHSASFAT